MEFWLTDHGRGLSALTIRTEDERERGMPVTPVVNVMKGLQGKNVTNLGIFTDEDLRDLKDAIDERLQEQYGDAM